MRKIRRDNGFTLCCYRIRITTSSQGTTIGLKSRTVTLHNSKFTSKDKVHTISTEPTSQQPPLKRFGGYNKKEQRRKEIAFICN